MKNLTRDIRKWSCENPHSPNFPRFLGRPSENNDDDDDDNGGDDDAYDDHAKYVRPTFVCTSA